MHFQAENKFPSRELIWKQGINFQVGNSFPSLPEDNSRDEFRGADASFEISETKMMKTEISIWEKQCAALSAPS